MTAVRSEGYGFEPQFTAVLVADYGQNHPPRSKASFHVCKAGTVTTYFPGLWSTFNQTVYLWDVPSTVPGQE